MSLADGGELAVSVVDPINELLETDRDDDGTPTEVAAHLFADLMAMRLQLGPDSRSFMLATPISASPIPTCSPSSNGSSTSTPTSTSRPCRSFPGSTGTVPHQR